MANTKSTIVAILLLAVLPQSLIAQERLLEAPTHAAPESVGENLAKISFERDVLPILASRCHACHGPNTQESNYRLDNKNLALNAADLGEPSIIPGSRDRSPLFQFISDPESDTRMPPEGKPLSAQQIETIGRWIDQGADWPAEFSTEQSETLTTDHWSFQPIEKPRIPVAADQAGQQVVNPIDAFVLAELKTQGLHPADLAERATWIRRVYLVMHGLLPTTAQVDKFLADTSPQAFEKVIDEVLASPRYGERWARHWLDVVRFAESTGYEVNRQRDNAFYFRDYVIQSLNEDKSYRDFVMEQIAGDALGSDEATGFLVGGPHDIVKSPDINLTLMQREDELADYVNTTSTTFLGLTVGCARCHNHKFDPILQRDYYALQAIFAGVNHGERKLISTLDQTRRQQMDDLRIKIATLETAFNELREKFPVTRGDHADTLLPMVNAKLNQDQFEPITAKFIRFTISKTNSVEPCIDELEVYTVTDNRNVALVTNGAKLASSGDYPNSPIHQLKHLNDGNYGNSHSWISNTPGRGWVQVEFAETSTIDRVVWGRDREEQFKDRLPIEYQIEVADDQNSWVEVFSSTQRKPFVGDGGEPEDAFIARLPADRQVAVREQFKELLDDRARLKEIENQVPQAYIGTFAEPKPIHRLHRGDPMSPRELVSPDVLRVMGSLELEENTPEQKRRLELAQWIVEPDNPLTPRVIVNRVWQHHFGRGIVATPSDFGKMGSPPTHPQLLDWLATEFMNHGWSLKWLHRQILSSVTFAQSSRPDKQALAVDADNRFLWRFTPRRLEAESIRDCVLQVTGKLNLKPGGPGFLLFSADTSETVHHYFPLKKFESEHFRRMIYMTKIRQEQDEVFGVFDCPDGGQNIPERSRSTTPLQALNLLNSKFMIQQADFLATDLTATAGDDIDKQIRLAFSRLFFREPADAELRMARNLIEEHGLSAFCRALLNANEFLFVS